MEIFILIVLQAIIFGYFARYIAIEKNRDSTIWFILGFFFSLLAILALIAIPKSEIISNVHNKNEEKTTNGFKKCPDCAEYIRADARICRFCRHNFTDEEIAEELNTEDVNDNYEDVDELENDQKVICPNCGTETSINKKYCSWCGVVVVK